MRAARSDELSPDMLAKLKRLNEDAFSEPFVEDWDHALGGMHFFIEEDGEALAHASVVERRLETGGLSLRTGYVEAVATRPGWQRRGLASRVLHAAIDSIRSEFELGALSSGLKEFYEGFGFETWAGPTSVRTEGGLIRTKEEDGYVMILRTPLTPRIDLAAAISCEWRSGDVW